MLNKTAIRHPSFIAKLDGAMREAAERSRGRWAVSADGRTQSGVAYVHNSEGRAVALVVHKRGPRGGFEFRAGGPGHWGADITAITRAALAEALDRSSADARIAC